MKRLLTYLAINAAFMLLMAPAAMADRVPELDAMSNEELITSLDLGKHAQAVRDAQSKEAKKLINSTYKPADGCNVETYRGGEVIIISIPAHLLFEPNGTGLMPEADLWLKPMKKYAMASKPDYFRMLLVMHTDNTGSPEYTDELSLKRVDAIFERMAELGFDTSYIFPTAAGATDPIKPNNTVAGRDANRRLEVYLIPGKEMLEAAKKVAK